MHKFLALKSNVTELEDRFIPSLHVDFYKKDFFTVGIKRDSQGRLVAIVRVGKICNSLHILDTHVSC